MKREQQLENEIAHLNSRIASTEVKLNSTKVELNAQTLLIGAVAATIPLGETLKACENGATFVKYFKQLHHELEAEKKRLDAVANGFSVWQMINLETATEQWFCQYSIEGIAVADTLREAIDKGIEEHERL